MRPLILITTLAAAGCSSSTSSTCTPACGQARLCCNGACVNPDNDPKNCGACGTTCSGATPFCDGTCKATPCEVDGGSCAGGALCCGSSCCTTGQICCKTEGQLERAAACVAAEGGTCPQGCAPLCVSDRALKEAVAPVDEALVLEQLSSLPLSTWSYTTDPSRTRHLGPMAQDFRAAFALGDTDQAYDPIDAHGVSLASLKALKTMLDAQAERIARLEAENRALQQRVCR